jgi:TolA-binding protein
VPLYVSVRRQAVLCGRTLPTLKGTQSMRLMRLLAGSLLGLVLAGWNAFGASEQAKAIIVNVQTSTRPDTLTQAERQIRSGEVGEAEALLRGWLTANADSAYMPEAEYMLGQARFAQGDYAGAKFYHEKVLDHRNVDRSLKALAYFARADCNYEMQSYFTASRQYHCLETVYRDVRAVPHDELLFKLGMATRQAGFEETSNYWFNKVIELYATTKWGAEARKMNTTLNGSRDGVPTRYVLEVKKYNDEAKALSAADELRKKGYASVDVQEETNLLGNRFYRLTVGRFFNRNEALSAKEDADMAGLSTSIHPGLMDTSK